mgnify:CR=1 FL=1
MLATLHTNDAASAVTRLADMGVEPYLLASSLLGVLAQRLGAHAVSARAGARGADRRRAATARRAWPAAPITPVWQRAGLRRSATNRAISGRTGIYELLRIDETLRRLIHDGAGEHDAARCRDARRHAARCVATARGCIADGSTSLAELTRVTREQ